MDRNRYNLQNLRTAVRNPRRAAEELWRLAETPLRFANNTYFRRRYGDGVDVIQRDWDNLILLDACRFDYFQEVNTIPGDLDVITSAGAHSWEFMESNFVGRDLHDTVYVTANPHSEKLADDTFYTIETVLDKWQKDPGTVLPRDVVQEAMGAHNEYPNKRLIVHFMQPHKPWLGPTAERIRERVDLKGWDKYHARDESVDRTGVSLWKAAREGHVTQEEIVRGYTETLEIVLKEVQELLESLDGKSIVTADHGEMLGEQIVPGTRRRYGHPHDIYTPELCRVPWLETDYETRREVESEEPIGFQGLDDSVVNDRLQALGYAPEDAD